MKRAAVIRDAECASKAAQRGAFSDTRCLENIPFQRPQKNEDVEVRLKHQVKAQDKRDGAVHLLVWKSLDAMAYVRQGSKCLDAKWLGSLSSQRRASMTVYAGKLRTTEPILLVERCTGPGACFKKSSGL